jgi:hypothetical protein
MKKLIAIAVLFISLAAAAFAQDEGQWKVGLMARFATDLLYATSAKAKAEYSVAGSETETIDLPGANKGTINFFGNHAGNHSPFGDPRLQLSLSNSGENYTVYAEFNFDNWFKNWGGVWDFLQHGGDFEAKGTAGIFDGYIGSKNGYNGFVSSQASWNDYIGWNTLCRFGVWRAGGPNTYGNADNNENNSDNPGFVASDTFQTWTEWGAQAVVGITPVDNFRFALGYRINPITWGAWAPNGADPYESKSSINATFMFSGRVAELLDFDLFYAVIGRDNDTAIRPATLAAYSAPPAYWKNTLGAFVGLHLIENLGISVGYTVNFNAYETGGYLPNDDRAFPERSQPVTWNAPVYSGIDIRVKYDGIDKLGLIFNNNISFASVKSKKMENGYNPVVTASLLNEGKVAGFDNMNTFGQGFDTYEGTDESWFHWEGELKASLGFIEGVGITVHLADRLGVFTEDYIDPWVNANTGNAVTTKNEFRVSVFADYGIGAVSVGAGLFFGLESSLDVGKVVINNNASSYSLKSDVVKFGIPIFFKVAF